MELQRFWRQPLFRVRIPPNPTGNALAALAHPGPDGSPTPHTLHLNGF